MTACRAFRLVVEEMQTAMQRQLTRMEIRCMAAFFNWGRIYEMGPGERHPQNEREAHAMCDALVEQFDSTGGVLP